MSGLPSWCSALCACVLTTGRLWFLSWGGKPSLGKKVLPWPSSFISVVCSQMSYWSGAGSLEHCFQTAEAEAAWKSSDETRMIIAVSYEAFLQSQPGRNQWVAKAWLRDRTGLKTENFAHLKVSQASVWCRWIIGNRCLSIDLCFLQHEKNGVVSELASWSLPENGPSWPLPVGPPPSLCLGSLWACFSTASTAIPLLKFIRGKNC